MPTSPDPARPGYVAWLLRQRDNTDVRVALRRADVPTFAGRAVPHLARHYTPATRDAMLLHAAAFAMHTNCVHTRGNSLGTVARTLVRRGILSEQMLRTRLAATQTQQLPAAHRTFRMILDAAHNARIGVDWHSLWATYRHWDDTNTTVRRDTRWAVLEDFENR